MIPSSHTKKQHSLAKSGCCFLYVKCKKTMMDLFCSNQDTKSNGTKRVLCAITQKNKKKKGKRKEKRNNLMLKFNEILKKFFV